MIEIETPKRRWLQFKLRTLLVVVLVLSLPLSWFAVKLERVRKQRQAATAILQFGGRVEFDWELDKLQREAVELGEPRTPAWIRRTLGTEYSDVVFVSLWGSRVHNPDLLPPRQFPNLRSLEIIGVPITDAGVKQIKTLTSLKILILDRMQVTPVQVNEIHAAMPDCTIITTTLDIQVR